LANAPWTKFLSKFYLPAVSENTGWYIINVFLTIYIVTFKHFSVTMVSVPNRRGTTRFQNPPKMPLQGIWLKGGNTVQLTSTKFETLVPEKKNAILTESFSKSG